MGGFYQHFSKLAAFGVQVKWGYKWGGYYGCCVDCVDSYVTPNK